MAAFKIPDTPPMTSNAYELADYLEILCLVNDGFYSTNDALSHIGIVSDEENNGEGIMNDDDTLYDNLQQALQEVDRRNIACAYHYPFTTYQNQILLREAEDKIHIAWQLAYVYLLLATRLNMLEHKRVDDIDGTLLFEHLSAIAVKNYFGDNAKSIVFGTGVKGGFKEKVAQLINSLDEGGFAQEPEDSTCDEKDGGLDVVIWKAFADQKKGKFIGFGQCKTGTEWRSQVGALLPNEFCKSFFSKQPIYSPVKMFFVAESFRENWEKISRRAGILFERCRIMENLSDIDKEEYNSLMQQMRRWVDGQLSFTKQAYTQW